MGGNGEERRKNESHCLQFHFLPASLGPRAVVVSLADQAHPFKGVHYVPIKAIREPNPGLRLVSVFARFFPLGWITECFSTFLHQFPSISPRFPCFRDPPPNITPYPPPPSHHFPFQSGELSRKLRCRRVIKGPRTACFEDLIVR